MPNEMSKLIQMPGVGRKTANVILQELYKIPSGMVVDTHVARITGLLGLSEYKDPIRIEKDLMEKIPKKYWMDWSLYMIFLGRSFCTAKKRDCQNCFLNDLCPSSQLKAKKAK